jgi:hypothetical protein
MLLYIAAAAAVAAVVAVVVGVVVVEVVPVVPTVVLLTPFLEVVSGPTLDCLLLDFGLKPNMAENSDSMGLESVR